MLAPEPQFTTTDVLRAFNRDQIYLFLGAAIATVGILSGAFALLRRRRDPLLIWFALFAIFYGFRLWLDYQLLGALQAETPLYDRLRTTLGFLVPVPAFFFFNATGLLGPAGKRFVNALSVLLVALVVLNVIIGPRPLWQQINNGLVIVSLITLVTHSLRAGNNTPEFVLLRRGLFAFVAFAFWQNVVGPLHRFWNVEPIGFVIFLGCLGIVTARRTLAQEQQLSIIQKELEIARDMQRSILPPAFPPSASFRVAVRYLPMTSVAGDFYDFILAGDHEAGLLIADVSGHGVPAALIASMVKLAASTQRAQAASPAALLGSMNAALLGNTQSQFVTAAYVYLNAVTRELRYAAAAHPPMLLLRNGEVSEIAENGLMLAAFDFATYTTTTRPLEPGDRLVLYTDGILEATDAGEQEFGRDRLHTLLRETAGLSHTAAADQIVDAVRQFSPTQTDDLTILVCDLARDTHDERPSTQQP